MRPTDWEMSVIEETVCYTHGVFLEKGAHHTMGGAAHMGRHRGKEHLISRW